MKKLVLICFLMLAALGVNAQKKGDSMVCTGNNVNVRTGPGLNYRVLTEYGQKVQLMKGNGVGDGYMECEHETGNCVLVYEGKTQNGFMLISYLGEGVNVQGRSEERRVGKEC